MEQAVLLLDQIVTTQKFLKFNYHVLNEYWIKPHLGLTPDPNYMPNPDLEQQISQAIEQIDTNIYNLLQIIKSTNIINLILECVDLKEFQTLIYKNFTGISFGFGIPQEFKPQLEELGTLDLNTLVDLGIQFVIHFKTIFGYKFLDLLTEELINQIIKTFLHVKKLYLEYYKKPNET